METKLLQENILMTKLYCLFTILASESILKSKNKDSTIFV